MYMLKPNAWALNTGNNVAGEMYGTTEWKRTQQLQQQQQAFNAEEAQKNRDWQERMANTAFQRQKADLQQAGYNPALLLNTGSGAYTGSGAVASSGNYNAPFTTAAFTSMYNTLLNGTFKLFESAFKLAGSLK